MWWVCPFLFLFLMFSPLVPQDVTPLALSGTFPALWDIYVFKHQNHSQKGQMLTMSGHRSAKMQSGLPLLPLRKVFRPKIALFEWKCPSFSLFGQAEMVGFLLVKCMFHTVQLRNVGEHDCGSPWRHIWPPTWEVGLKKASWKGGGYAAAKCMSRVSQVTAAERGCQARWLVQTRSNVVV